MMRLIRSPVFQRQLLTCGISTSRTLLVALQTVKTPLTSLNGAAASAKLGLDGTLEEVATSHFSESAAFPEFSPMEDTLLGQAVPRIQPKSSTMTSLNRAATRAKLNINGTLEKVASNHFSEASVFPEFSPVEDTLLSEAMPYIQPHDSTLASLNRAAVSAKLDIDGTLEGAVSSHFSESSAFPEFSGHTFVAVASSDQSQDARHGRACSRAGRVECQDGAAFLRILRLPRALGCGRRGHA